MTRWLFILFVFLMGYAASGCSFSVQDTPELRDKVAAYNSGNPVPDLPEGGVPELPIEEQCFDVKGNLTASGEKIYHVQGQANYNTVKPEAYFCSEKEAEEAGFRKALR